MEAVNAAKLRSITLDNWQPVSLDVDGENLVLEYCLRLLPGKRIAAQAQYRGETVFAKVMFGPSHGKLAEREMEILQQLQAGDVPVPRPLALRHGEGVTVILTEWLGAAEPITNLICKGNERVLDALLTQIDRIYRAGFYQRDLHLENFVWFEGCLRVLDAGVMRRLPVGRFRRTRLQICNLALLCAQASLDCSDLLRTRIEHHFQLPERHRRHLGRSLKQARNRRIRHARRKWLRPCSALRQLNHEGGDVLVDRTLHEREPELVNLLRDPEQAPLIKRGSRIHVHATEAWVIKCYRDYSVRARLKQWLGLDASRRSWVMGWTLSMLGVPTPRPVAWLREHSGQAALIYPRLKGPRLSELMEQEPEYAEAFTPVVLYWLRLMGKACCWHGDTKAQNILLVNESPWLIDLDAAGWSPWVWKSRRRHKNDVRRFRANSKQFVPATDCLPPIADETRETKR